MDMSRENGFNTHHSSQVLYDDDCMITENFKMNVEKSEWAVCGLVRIIEAELRLIWQLLLSPLNGYIQQTFMK